MKWIVIILIAVAGWLFYQYGIDFVSKVNTTVNKANSSMERDANNINSAIQYNSNH